MIFNLNLNHYKYNPKPSILNNLMDFSINVLQESIKYLINYHQLNFILTLTMDSIQIDIYFLMKIQNFLNNF